ncbi:MAG: tyrosine-type recombinase/integrase [Muribaculaceae bacterium]|nr:tyrosine-type recombinase/integrase [Muribaculaceae bacterium]
MLQKYFDYLTFELNRAPLTVNAYKRDIFQFCNWLAPDASDKIDFTLITAADVRTWLASLAKEGEAPVTLRRKIISLRSLFKWMMKTGILKKSPLTNVPLPKIPKPLPDLIKNNEIEEAINKLRESEDPKAPQNYLMPLIIEMLYTLGIRRAELVGINDEDISFFKGEVKVLGKRSKQRIIPVPQSLLNKISKWQTFRDQNLIKPIDENPLFIIKGKRISPEQVYRLVKKALAESSARKKSPHALRHSFASGMLNGGAELDSVREFLGHSSIATTQIYTHISLNEIKKAYSLAHPRASVKKEPGEGS